MASLINRGKHMTFIRITNREPRKGRSHLNHDDHLKVTGEFCLSFFWQRTNFTISSIRRN